MFLFLLMCFDVILQNESRRAGRRMKNCRSTCRKLQSEITLILRINIALMFLYHHCRGDAPGSLLTCGFMQLFSSVRVSREDTVYIHLLFTPHASCVIHTVAAHIYNIVLTVYYTRYTALHAGHVTDQSWPPSASRGIVPWAFLSLLCSLLHS